MRARAARLAEPPNALSLLLVGVLAVIVWHNAFTYPSVSGPDAEPDIAYAQTIVNEWRIPTVADAKSYYTPPGFFLLAGGMIKLGEALGAVEPAQYGQLLNGILTLATALLLAALCALVFPGRPWLRVAALGLFVACPVVLKTGAMFHPQPLVAFFATLALVLAARMIGNAATASPLRSCSGSSSGRANSSAPRASGRWVSYSSRFSRRQSLVQRSVEEPCAPWLSSRSSVCSCRCPGTSTSRHAIRIRSSVGRQLR